MLRNAVGGVRFPGNKRYEGVRFNVITITRGWVGIKFPGKKHYVTLEWILSRVYIVFMEERSSDVICTIIQLHYQLS